MNPIKYLIATLGGFQFGYAIGIMAGAILFIAPEFSLTPEMQGWVVSAFLIGTLPGAGIAGPIANKIGRKKAQQLIALFFFIGTMVICFAPSISQIIAGRILQGLASGAITVIGPTYLAEISPAARRGFYVGCYQLAITIGIFVAYGVNFLLSSTGNWPWMFGLAIIPALLHFFGVFALPDTLPPQERPSSWKTLFDPTVRSATTVALLLNIFQQISGVNAILYFAPSIFQACGFTTPAMALLPPIFIGIINFLMTIFATFLIDRLGRRPLLLSGILGMVISLFGLIFAFLSHGALMKWLATFSIMAYIASFAISLGPIPQLIGTELFPRRVRGQGMSVAMMGNWIFNFLVVFSFMDFTSRFSHAATFALYALCTSAALYFAWKYVPETNGRVLN